MTTILFTDIEGSTRLWEREPARMASALAAHDKLCRVAVVENRGTVVKTTGDGLFAAFDDATDALRGAVALQAALSDPAATCGIRLPVRAGLHEGCVERRDNDVFGAVVSRAARIMSAAHGGQTLLFQAVFDHLGNRLPADVELRSLGAVRLRDLASPEHVYQVVKPGLRQSFPALRSLEATPQNLPQQVTTFVGRQQQVAEVEAWLRKSRLVTLVGAGGLGKSRLSLQVAADVLDDFPDGAWLVELAALSAGRLVPDAVAFVLGVKEPPGSAALKSLVDFAKDRQFLLVLDNCEHVLDACAALVERLLAAAPYVSVLATSREPLRQAGEVVYHVAPLAVPDADAPMSLDALVAFDAMRLFRDRAVAAQPAFAITERNADTIAAICRRLDGIPLAIELAAARVRHLPIDRIAARLADRFELLTGGSRAAPARAQTLRACIDWSYALLDDAERALLRRLAVFAGGFAAEGAEAVGAADEAAAPGVLDLLSRLVDKSLVELDAPGERYRMLESVRQYAHERLEASGEVAAARDRHLEFCLALAAQADTGMEGSGQGEWLARLALEQENLLAAHAWCGLAECRTQAGLQLVVGVQRYWTRRGLLRLGYRVTTEALSRPGARVRTLARCRALYAAADQCFNMHRFDEALSHVQESLAIARDLEDRDRVAAALLLMSWILVDADDVAGARRCHEEALALAEASGSPLRLSSARGALARIRAEEGDIDGARRLLEQSLAISRREGHRAGVCACLCNLTLLSLEQGDVARVRELLLAAVGVEREVGLRSIGRSLLALGAGLAASREEWERAARLYGATYAEWRREGYVGPEEGGFLASTLARARAALGAERFAAAEAAGALVGYDEAMAEMRAWLATIPTT